jgi:hypothetical protein
VRFINDCILVPERIRPTFFDNRFIH